MSATLKPKKSRSIPLPTAAASAVRSALPPSIRVLYIASRLRTGGWLAEAFAGDSASEIVLEEAVGSAAGMGRLRDEAFDAVLVSHVPGELDALDLIEGYRAGGAEDPIVVLGTQSEQEMAVLCHEVGADGYVCVNTTTTRHLIWVVARAVQRHQLMRENRRLNQADKTRLQRERDEAERLLEQQRSILAQPDAAPGPARPKARNPAAAAAVAGQGSAGNPATPLRRSPPSLPAELIAHYRELLRTYVIMGSGTLSEELARLAEMLVRAGLSARQTMELHLYVLEELIHGLGTRSSRHVMTRADLLALELVVNLADGYRRRHLEHLYPPVQKRLPGF